MDQRKLPQQKGLKRSIDDQTRLIKQLNDAIEMMAKRGRQAHANFIICSPQIANVINSINEVN
jgi:hypothetical protein